MLFVFLSGVLFFLKISGILGLFINMMESVFVFLFKLFVVVFIVLIGWFVVCFVCDIIMNFFVSIGMERFVVCMGLFIYLKDISFFVVIGIIVYVLILILVVILVFD